MNEVLLNTTIDKFIFNSKIKSFVDNRYFKNEEEFLQAAINEMIKKTKIYKENKDMDNFAGQMAKKYKKNLSAAVIESRKEEDERL